MRRWVLVPCRCSPLLLLVPPQYPIQPGGRRGVGFRGKSVCREYGIEADSGYFRRSYLKAAGLFLMGLFGADVPKTVKIVVEIASMFTTESASATDTDSRAMSYKRFQRKGSQRNNLAAKACKISLVRSFCYHLYWAHYELVSLCAQVDFDPSSGKASRIDAQLSYQASMRKEKTDRATELEQRKRESTDAERLFAFPDAKSKERATRPSSSRR